jgi:hypothetical protein
MSNIPLVFGVTDLVNNPSLHLSYTFDKITSIEAGSVYLPIGQDYKIQAIQIDLEGKTSNPNISVSIDSVTRLFTLNTCYITDLYSRMETTNPTDAFVIEGYSVENINKERVFIFLPMQTLVDTDNIFFPLEKAIIENAKLPDGLDLNEFIPATTADTDLYTYYKFTDNKGIIFHVIYFNTSRLGHTPALAVPKNINQYESTDQILNYKSTTLAKRHTNMSNQFEDNIYIDCVPVDLINQKEQKYLHIDKNYAKKFRDFLIYFAYILVLTLIVYGIYYIYIYISQSKPIQFPVQPGSKPSSSPE